MENFRGIRRFIKIKPDHSQKFEITNLDSHGRLVKGILFPSRFGIVECVSWLKSCKNSDLLAFSFAIHLDPKESLVIILIHDKKRKEGEKVGCESEGILRVLVSKDPHTKDQAETPPLHCLPDSFITTDVQIAKQKYETKRFTGNLDPLDELISIKPILWSTYGKDPPVNVKILHLSTDLYSMNALTDGSFEKCECRGKEAPEMPKGPTTQSTQIVEQSRNQETKKQKKKKCCIIL
ncbi:hypothetical protein CAEBREN_03893 [Caenorhabditis brenneri]|uniref:Uncharacterized protein n=1 Tax=Caenorhabditis brenneri TaxID=135651 RepID=G0MQC9_CAEBE|nr:hypothetical protein CAEBREN_03893 [Caenorhabditis brenneri]